MQVTARWCTLPAPAATSRSSVLPRIGRASSNSRSVCRRRHRRQGRPWTRLGWWHPKYYRVHHDPVYAMRPAEPIPFRSYTWFPDSLSSPRNCHETVEGRLPNALVFIAERGRSFSPPPGGDGHPGPGLPLAVQPPTVVFFHDPPLPARSLPC